MHKIEIRRKADVPENNFSSGMNTELLIDGVQIKTAQRVTLEWDATGTCTATIKMVGNIQAEFYGEKRAEQEDQQFLLIPTGENAARLSTVALERVRRGSEEEADLRAKQDEARQKKVRAFVVRYKLKSGDEVPDGLIGELHFLPGELCHPKGDLKLRAGWAWENPGNKQEDADTQDSEFAEAVVSMYNANREMIQELDQLAPRLEPERVLVSWRWEERFASEISRGIYVQPTSESKKTPQEIWEEKDKRERRIKQIAENIAGDSIHRVEPRDLSSATLTAAPPRAPARK